MKKNGFTLIEVLMAIAIVSVLSAIAIPQFNEYKSRANDLKARSDAKNAVAVMTISAKG